MAELTSSENIFYGVGFSFLIGVVSFGIVFMSKNAAHADSNDVSSKPHLDNTKKSKKSKKKKSKKLLSPDSESLDRFAKDTTSSIEDPSDVSCKEDDTSSQSSKMPECSDAPRTETPIIKSADESDKKRKKKKKKKQKQKQQKNKWMQSPLVNDRNRTESIGCQITPELVQPSVDKQDSKNQTVDSCRSISNLEEENADLHKKFAVLEETYKSQTTDLKLCKQLLKIADNRADKLSQQLKMNQLDYVSKDKRYAADRDLFILDVNHLRQELAMMCERNRELSDQIVDYREQVEHWKAEVETREGANIEGEIQNSELSNRVQDMEAQLETANEKVATLQDQYESQQTKYKEAMEKEKHALEQTEELLSCLQDSVDDEVNKWRHDYLESQDELNKLKLEFEDPIVSSPVILNEDDVSDHEMISSEITDDVSDLNFAYTCMEKSLTGIVDEMNHRITELEDQCDDLRKERDEQSRCIEELLKAFDCDSTSLHLKSTEELFEIKSPRFQLNNRFSDFFIF